MSKVAYYPNIWGGPLPDSNITIHSTASSSPSGNDFIDLEASDIFVSGTNNIYLSATNIYLSGIVIGPVEINGTFTQYNGFAYLGAFNTQTFPTTSGGGGLAVNWNFSGGGGEVDFWNRFPVASPTNDTETFIFKQMTGTGAAQTVAAMYGAGRFEAAQFTSSNGLARGAATQLELLEDAGDAGTGAAQVNIDRTEDDTPGTGEEAQIIISHSRTGGTGSRAQVQAQIDTTVGGASEDIIGWNGLAYCKKDGAAYAMDAAAAIFAVHVDPNLPDVNTSAIEVDTMMLGDVARKIGISVVDEVGSVGTGTNYDAGIVIGKQAGSRGFNYGLQFGFSLGNAAPEINNAFLYCPTGTIAYAVDFSGVTFSTAAWKGDFTASGFVGTGTVAVASLPTAAAGNKGYRAMVSNSNATMTAGIGAVVAGGGANVVPVYSDGANWRIG